MFGNELPVTGLAEEAGVLAEEFLAAMKALGKPVFGWRFFAGSFGRRQSLKGLFFFVVGHVATDPGQDLPSFRQDRLDDLAAKRPAAFVAAAVVR